MNSSTAHTFHIPVLGLAFSIDTPIRVARFGISSVISIVDDVLIEHMRKHYTGLYRQPYVPISVHDHDYRARRITEYLNLVQRIVRTQVASLKTSAFDAGSDIIKYFELLADTSPLKALYHRMMRTPDAAERSKLQDALRETIVPGAIDVNIMTKVDKTNTDRHKVPLPVEFSDALASLRGFVQSDLQSSVVLSAGLNLRLFAYISRRPEFFPDANGFIKNKIILKVSDYRSALIQGKLLAKKGVWTSEFRIESGLNCGGHVFASDGYLLGPILEQFRRNRQQLAEELHTLYAAALQERGIPPPAAPRPLRITVQGGIGTAQEDEFLRTHYGMDGTGWGSPFLLVPEATNVDDETRARLAAAREDDFYLSDVSPLGVPFNNLRGSRSELLARRRTEEGRPGSPCTKKFLVSNTEFTSEPICTASRQYQALKIKQIQSLHLAADEEEARLRKVTAKVCLCEDLAAAALINTIRDQESTPVAVAVCPGPNLAYFSRIATLEEMVGHIYGRVQLLTVVDRSHMFVNELRLYIDYLRNEIQRHIDTWTDKEEKYFSTFKAHLQEGISYYRELIPQLVRETEQARQRMAEEIRVLEQELAGILTPSPVLC